MTTTVRDRWNDGVATIGVWLTIPSSECAETVARIGFDYCCMDLQHGVLDYQSSVAMIQAVTMVGGSPIARVPWNEPGIVGKLLDAGAHGVVVPMVNSPAEAASVVRAVRYPPLGARSYGPVMAGMRESGYDRWSNDHVAVIPMIETREAVASIDSILAVPGIDAIYVGPADLSLSLGLRPQNNDGEALFDDALAAVIAACNRAGVVAGIHATPELTTRRLEQGFRMVTMTNEIIAMRVGLAGGLAACRGPVTPSSAAAGARSGAAIY